MPTVYNSMRRPGMQNPRWQPLRLRWLKMCAGVQPLVVCSLIVATLLLLSLNMPRNDTGEFLQAPASGDRGGPPAKYTVLINTWKRNDLLRTCIAHYMKCQAADAIRVVWSDPTPPPADLLRLAADSADKDGAVGGGPLLVFDIHKEDSLNNRFKPLKDVRTDAVFSIDDDLLVPCGTLSFAFQVWRSAPLAMVGYVPRLVSYDTQTSAYSYLGWWTVWWRGRYSLVLTKAAFFHERYLSLYTHDMPESVRDYVHRNRNCEDIAMSFLVANETKAPPIWVKGKIREIGSSGISSMSGHTLKRTKCVNDFTEMFGGVMPLVEGATKAADASHDILW